MARVVQRGRTSMPTTRLATAVPSGTSRKSRRVMTDPDLHARGTVPHHIAAAIEGVSVASGTLTAHLSETVNFRLRTGPKGGPLCPDKRTSGTGWRACPRSIRQSQHHSRSTTENVIMTSPRATSTGYRHDSPAAISVQKPQCVGEFACAPWCVAWSSSIIVIAANATEATKARSIVCVIPGKWCRQRRGSPRRDHLRGLLGSSRLGTSANPTILALAISPPDRVQYVAAVRHQRDLIPSERRGRPAPATTEPGQDTAIREALFVNISRAAPL